MHNYTSYSFEFTYLFLYLHWASTRWLCSWLNLKYYRNIFNFQLQKFSKSERKIRSHSTFNIKTFSRTSEVLKSRSQKMREKIKSDRKTFLNDTEIHNIYCLYFSTRRANVYESGICILLHSINFYNGVIFIFAIF